MNEQVILSHRAEQEIEDFLYRNYNRYDEFVDGNGNSLILALCLQWQSQLRWYISHIWHNVESEVTEDGFAEYNMDRIGSAFYKILNTKDIKTIIIFSFSFKRYYNVPNICINEQRIDKCIRAYIKKNYPLCENRKTLSVVLNERELKRMLKNVVLEILNKHQL